ncbi:MAG TPA: sigma-70 family RNA polymerase sigma factor [Ktedonobacterales bacterium]
MNPRDLFSRGSLRRTEDATQAIQTPPSQDAGDDIAYERLWIARAQKGDQEAFAVLVRRHQRQVHQLAMRMLRDEDEASEATQEVFLAAWQHLRSFRGEARLATWLYRITYNHCLKVSECRRRDQEARQALAETSRESQSSSQLSASIALAAERDVQATVRQQIDQLPQKYKRALVLRHLQDLSYEEMADVMRVPIGTVKTQLFRARMLLKERLDGLERARAEGVARAGELRAGLEANLRTVLDQRLDLARHGNSKGDGQ